MPDQPKRFSTIQRSAAGKKRRETSLDPTDADILIDLMEAERMDSEEFIETISTEERSGRGASRLMSETGGRVNRTKGSE